MKNLLCKTIALVSLLAGLAPHAREQAEPPPGVEQQVQGLLNQMTLEEKVDLLGGTDGFFVRAVPRLRIPRLRMADGPLGVRNFGPATAMAGGVALAATWNPQLAERVGAVMSSYNLVNGEHASQNRHLLTESRATTGASTA
jgi:beta-glucosidase